MLQNKLLYELRIHLCLGQTTKVSVKIIKKMLQIIQQYNKFISPIRLIEISIFNLIIPIELYGLEISINLKGKILKQSITKSLISIIKYAKNLKSNQSIAHKLAIIFVHIYKKDHILYKQKLLYLDKILNI